MQDWTVWADDEYCYFQCDNRMTSISTFVFVASILEPKHVMIMPSPNKDYN